MSGQAVKDDIGTVRIQRPHKGPFYVTHKTIDQLIAHLGKWARLLYTCALQMLVLVHLGLPHIWHDPSFVFDVIIMDASCRLYKYASMGLTLFGAYLLAKHAFQYVMERRRHWELRKRYCFTGVYHYHCCLHPIARQTRKCISFIIPTITSSVSVVTLGKPLIVWGPYQNQRSVSPEVDPMECFSPGFSWYLLWLRRSFSVSCPPALPFHQAIV